MDIIFLMLEYSGVPIGLLLYSVIIKQLSNSDPIPTSKSNDGLWGYGLELMVIISVSTLLYGVSFAGHADGKTLPPNKLICIIWCLAISIVEFFFLVFVTLKVRKWGEKHRSTKLYPNVTAFGYWLILIIIIIICSNYCHKEVKVEELPKNEIGLFSWINSDNHIVLLLLGILVLLVIAFFILKLVIKKIRNNAIHEYNIGSHSLKSEPTIAIKNLTDSLKKIPDDSPLIIDIYMKLSRIHRALSQDEEALKQIELLEQTSAFKSLNSYLLDGIIKAKFQILLSLKRINEAENLIPLVVSKETSEKLKIQIYEANNKK